jgi:hypothetical protein
MPAVRRMPPIPANTRHVKKSATPERIKGIPRQRRSRSSPAPGQPPGKVEKRRCRPGSHFDGIGSRRGSVPPKGIFRVPLSREQTRL